NALSRAHPDASGLRPSESLIAPSAPAMRSLPAPTRQLVAAARAADVPAALSHDAGRYLCNYLCWRASEQAARSEGPCIVAFVHVPEVLVASNLRKRTVKRPLTLDHLVQAAEAIVLAALAPARTRRS